METENLTPAAEVQTCVELAAGTARCPFAVSLPSMQASAATCRNAPSAGANAGSKSSRGASRALSRARFHDCRGSRADVVSGFGNQGETRAFDCNR